MNLLLFQKKRLSKGISLALDFMGGTLDSRISFSRGSNATVVGSNGLIQYAPHNLLTYSEQFDNAAWTKSNAVISANVTTAPDGTTTADLFTRNNILSYITQVQSRTAVAAPFSFSVYVKQSVGNYCAIRLQGTYPSRIDVVFNLSTGAISFPATNYGLATGGIATIQTVSGGYFRITIAGTLDGLSTNVQGVVSFNSNNVVVDGNDSVTNSAGYLWGAQLNQGELQPYYSTTVKNLLGYSQNFENAAWTKSNSSIAASTVIGPFGFDGGQKLVENTTASVGHYIQPLPSPSFTVGQVLTYSVYTKAAERTFLQLILTGVGSGGANLVAGFDLTNGVAGTPNAGTSTIVPIGNGWFRCSFTISVLTAASTGAQIRLSANSSSTPSSYTGDGTSGIYIFGAQLSDSASLDPYSYNPVAAPTSTAYYGPRFDYDPVTLAPKGLLIEEQRTNLMLYSEDLSTVWNLGTGTVQSNTWTAPTGNLTGDIFTIGSDSTTPSQSTTITASATYTLSFFVNKPLTTAAFLRLRFGTAAGSISAFIDASTMSFGVVQAGIVANYIKQIQNNIYQVSVRFTYGATDGGSRSLAISGVVANNSSVPDTGKNIAIWGIQYELGAFPTSYIPTTSATVTRAADNASMVGSNFSSWYNQSEGTIYAAVSFTNTSSFNTVYSITDGTSSNVIRTIQWNNGTDRPLIITTAGLGQTAYSTSGLIGNVKYCAAFALNNANYAKNGILGVDDTLVTLPAVNQLTLGNTTGGALYLNGWLQSIKYYPTRLPNADLQRLTR
jgi:hypothetical protein